MANQPLTIVALGSSSTAGVGASSSDAAYPSRLAAALKEHFPSNAIIVLNSGVNGEDAREMLDRFETSVTKPDLVLWQVGTNAVLRDEPVSPIGSLIREGVARMKALGADVILIDAQFAPRVLAKSENAHMLKLLATTAKETSVALFPRFAIIPAEAPIITPVCEYRFRARRGACHRAVRGAASMIASASSLAMQA